MRENSSGVSAPGPPVNCRVRTCSVRPLSRSSCVSPRQTMGVRPLASAIKLFFATLSSVSRKSCRRSECPMMTKRQPASASMVAETSPVNAPSLLQETFCPEMAMLVFFAASAAVAIAVKGGAMTMKNWGHLFVGQGFDARELAAAKELERGAAAGGDVRNFVGHAGLMHSSDGSSAADNGS